MGVTRVWRAVIVCVLASNAVAAELERLPAAKGTESAKPQVRLSMQLFEISRTKLRNLKHHADQDLVLPDKAKDGFWPVVEDAERVESVIESLTGSRSQMEKPVLLATSGQPAQFEQLKRIQIPPTKNINGQIIEHLECGTRIETWQEVQDDGSLKLTVAFSQSDFVPQLGLKQAGETIPAVKRREMKTSATLQPGQTLVLCGLDQERVEATRRFFGKIEETINEVQTVLVVRPEYTP